MPAAKLKMAKLLLKDLIEEKESVVTWKSLSPELKKRINESIKQADNGEVIDAFESVKNIRLKLGLNA
jgi:hypothetical protein